MSKHTQAPSDDMGTLAEDARALVADTADGRCIQSNLHGFGGPHLPTDANLKVLTCLELRCYKSRCGVGPRLAKGEP
jgi:hypothetical protein